MTALLCLALGFIGSLVGGCAFVVAMILCDRTQASQRSEIARFKAADAEPRERAARRGA